MEKNLNTEELATFCKKKGIIFQAAEIYGGLAGFFDYGPLGVELKTNLKNLYITEIVKKRENIVMQDGSIITNPQVWKASGHVDTFGDLILTTKKTKTKLRADHFIEDTLKISADGMNADEINDLIKKNNLKYNGEDFEEVKDFNLMFQTQIGADITKNSIGYLRPETCQSIFPNFKLIADSSRLTLPFGIVQIGKAFRNEISPRDFIFRCREFEQIEMEFFFNPESKCELLTEKELNTKFQFLSAKTQDENNSTIQEITIKTLIEDKLLNEYHAYWLATFFNFLTEKVGIKYENLRIREHVKTELSHYSKGTFDIDYKFSFGYKELLGIANRGNFDLNQHQNFSKNKLELFDEETKSKVLAEVIEPSLGVERFLMAVLTENYEDNKERGNVILKFPVKISPYKVSIHPLVNKDPLNEIAKNIYNDLTDDNINSYYDAKGSIGRRYARQDEIGTRFNITIDYETIEDGENKNTVTIRDRDTTEQKRIKLQTLNENLDKLIKNKIKFKDLK